MSSNGILLLWAPVEVPFAAYFRGSGAAAIEEKLGTDPGSCLDLTGRGGRANPSIAVRCKSITIIPRSALTVAKGTSNFSNPRMRRRSSHNVMAFVVCVTAASITRLAAAPQRHTD